MKDFEFSEAIILKSLDALLKETFHVVWDATKSGITYDLVKTIVLLQLWKIAKKGHAKINVSGRNLKEFNEEEFSRIITEEIQKKEGEE